MGSSSNLRSVKGRIGMRASPLTMSTGMMTPLGVVMDCVPPITADFEFVIYTLPIIFELSGAHDGRTLTGECVEG